MTINQNSDKPNLEFGNIVYEITSASTLEAVSEICTDLKTSLLRSIDEEIAGIIDLGVTETLSNIVRHGYHGDSKGVLNLSCSIYLKYIKIEITDFGDAIPKKNIENADGSVFNFDPMLIDEIPTGGMGISLIKKIFDKFDYSSENNVNILILVKNIS